MTDAQQQRLFQRILIANRGEIACRVQQTCKRLGIETVAVYSDADAGALHVRQADQAIRLGPAAARESYLHGDKIIAAAKLSGAEAIHPGYGFLSENAEFARAVAAAELVLIGPSADTMEQMGSKAAAKQTMRSAGVPVVPGYDADDQDGATLQHAADEIGYPLLIKAAAGGGGKGMRIVHSAAQFAEQLASAQREASSAFGDQRMILERYLHNPSHIEVQIFGDHHGNVVHLFERDCSSQRRYQKIIEEAPANRLPDAIQQAMHEAALQAARSVNYSGAGTVEFIVADDQFFFMEMNTRLQVEHPVTEMITGIDLVEWQLRVAAGQPLPRQQAEISQHGHAFEARIYAENPDQDFMPSAGTLQHLQFPPGSTALRVETGVVEGDEVSIHYDPMIAKLVVHADDRPAALHALQQALAATSIAGLQHNLGFLQWLAGAEIMRAEDPQQRIHTAWLDQNLQQLLQTRPAFPDNELIALAAMLFMHAETNQQGHCLDPWSPWSQQDGWRLGSHAGANAPRGLSLSCAGHDHQLLHQYKDDGSQITINADEQLQITAFWYQHGQAGMLIGGQSIKCQVHHLPDALELVHDKMRWRFCRISEQHSDTSVAVSQGQIIAPMPGRIIAINHAAGDQVTAGSVIIVMEAMKMELSLRADADACIEAVHVTVDDTVTAETCLVEFAN
ncbi:MAG: ATP-grasp domain-containing protein [Gammaproteobacteria bacterium]|jgi:3-methylcrotonyl-CoA carboxylase alpha subunit|nr:ATP-grasp domain-containing protein [Gammaproteobacteria bacterium]